MQLCIQLHKAFATYLKLNITSVITNTLRMQQLAIEGSMLHVAGVLMGCGLFVRPLGGCTHLGIAAEL